MYTVEKIKKLLRDDGRGIVIVDNSFIKMTMNATFIHPIYGEWVAMPSKVVLQKTTHPIEANLKRSTSNKKSREDGSVLRKTKQTNLSRYGCEFTGQVDKFIKKKENTSMNRYGTKSVLSIKKFRDIAKNTKKALYGDEDYTNRDKAIETNLSRYGYRNPMSNKSICSKSIVTKELKGLITRPRGKSWEELAIELGVPRTSLQEFVRLNPSDDAIEQFISSREKNFSNIELEFSKLMNVSKFVGSIEGYRPDFKIDGVYINIDGLYWHSQKIDRDRDYHFVLRKKFADSNLRILQFRADDIKYRKDIVVSMISNATNKTGTKLYARKCVIRYIDAKEANYFLRENHMMGPSNSRFIGLFYKDKLVSVMGFKVKNKILDIDRFASLLNHSIVGSLSKMIAFIKTSLMGKIESIHYWVDLRYGTGTSLSKIGFSFKRDIQGWQWTDFDKTFHRSKCRATKDLTQAENAEKMGLTQIFDAGQRLFVLDL